MAGGGPITSLPKHVLAGLARSLAVYSGMPEEIAWGHIKARGFTPPELDGQGAKMRGALLKILANEVLDENGKTTDDRFEPEAMTSPIKKNSKKKQTAAKPANSAETHVTHAVGVKDGDASDSDSSEVASKPRAKPDNEESQDDDATADDDSDDSDASESDASDDTSDHENDAFWFGKSATEAPPPPGANPFAMESESIDLQKEAADQIAEAKKIVAARRAAAAQAAAALASAVDTIEIKYSNASSRPSVAFTKEAVSIAAAAEERKDLTKSVGGGEKHHGHGSSVGTASVGGSSRSPSEVDTVGDANDKADTISVAGSDFPGSDAGTSVAGGSVAGSVAATHGSEEPPRVDDVQSYLGDYDDTASVATSRGALLEEDEDADNPDDGSEASVSDDSDSDSDSDDDKENNPEPQTRRVLRARRPPPTRAPRPVSVEDEVPVAAAAVEAETQASEQEKK